MERRPEYNYCKRHPSHMQSRGVCPFCLRERLSQISPAAAPTNLSNSNSSSRSSLSSSVASGPDDLSPPMPEIIKEKEPLKKSRSLAFVMEEEADHEKGKKKQIKKRKFWSKLMMGTRKEELLMHSKTMKEKSSSKWVVFS